jgi:hypothetical protein
MPPRPLLRLRKLSLALPDAHEVEAWGEPTFRVKKGKMFAMYAGADNHHGAGRPSVWIKATHENQSFIVKRKPKHYFVPPYVGPSGWIGAWLDTADWDEVAELLHDAWRLCAPKKLIAATEKAAAGRPS